MVMFVCTVAYRLLYIAIY